MSSVIGIDLWDKLSSIIVFNENNSTNFERLQKFVDENCKIHVSNLSDHNRKMQKFISDNEEWKKIEYSFTNYLTFYMERLAEVFVSEEIFGNSLMNEVQEVLKNKSLTIRSDTRDLKIRKKTMTDELIRETQKLDSAYKRYQNRFNTKEMSYMTYVKAEENKALSRNQVENYHTTYLNRKSEYDQAKEEYVKTLESFNQFQSSYYSSVISDWTTRAQFIENARYDILRSTATNLSEHCKSLASKLNETAEKLEFSIGMIDIDKDLRCLVNKERTGDIPPGDVPFKDLEAVVKTECIVSNGGPSNLSTSGSESTSTSASQRRSSQPTMKRNTSLSRSSVIASTMESKSISNSITSLKVTNKSNGSNLKLFGRLFGSNKKNKEIDSQSVQSEIENLESQLNQKLCNNPTYEFHEEFDHEVEDIKKRLSILRSSESNLTSNSKRSSLRKSSRNASVDDFYSEETDIVTRGRKMEDQSDKRRSRSVSNFLMSPFKMNNSAKPATDDTENNNDNSLIEEVPVKYPRNVIRRSQTQSATGKQIETIRSTGPVEIVSTPAEAMASASRVSSIYVSEYECFEPVSNGNIESESKIEENAAQTYGYYYTGSCVAIHEYKSPDISKIYLSFDVGEQFYIVKEDEDCTSSGWLLVERIDRSQIGYVPASYMDTRQFESPVLMYSNQPIMQS